MVALNHIPTIGEVIPVVLQKITDPAFRENVEMLLSERDEGLLLHPEQADVIREKFRQDMETLLTWEERWTLADDQHHG